MRYWRVLVKSGDGRQFSTRAVEISSSRAILRGEHALPAGMVCDLQVVVPPPNDKQPASLAGLQAQVSEVVFVSGGIRLELSVRSLSEEVQQLIDSRRVG